MSRDEMTDVLYDLQLVQSLAQIRTTEYSTPEQKDALLEGVLQKHGITKETLDSSIVWYSDRMDIFIRINDSVTSRLKHQSDVYEKLFAEQQERENIKQVSDFPSYYYLTPVCPYFKFNLDSTKITENNISSLKNMSFDVLGLSKDVKLQSEFYYEYTDTTVFQSNNISVATNKLNFETLSGRKLVNFSGYVHAEPVQQSSYRILLHNIKLNRDSVACHKHKTPYSLK